MNLPKAVGAELEGSGTTGQEAKTNRATGPARTGSAAAIYRRSISEAGAEWIGCGRTAHAQCAPDMPDALAGDSPIGELLGAAEASHSHAAFFMQQACCSETTAAPPVFSLPLQAARTGAGFNRNPATISSHANSMQLQRLNVSIIGNAVSRCSGYKVNVAAILLYATFPLKAKPAQGQRSGQVRAITINSFCAACPEDAR